MLAVAEHEQLPVGAARAGQPEAWNALFQRYQLPLYAYIFELVRSEQASLDIVQETFIAADRHIGGLRDDNRFGSWVFGIAHQKCIQHWRKSGREEPLDDESIERLSGVDDDPCELLIREEQEAEFMQAMNQLPSPQRSALLLHFIEDFPLDEIARITGTNLGTVKSRIHYAKKALRELLEDRSK
jgi:RNA polymerase sigma-70 factor (ECF subfamily)